MIQRVADQRKLGTRLIRTDKFYTNVENIGLSIGYSTGIFNTENNKNKIIYRRVLSAKLFVNEHRSGKFQHESAEFLTLDDFFRHVWIPTPNKGQWRFWKFLDEVIPTEKENPWSRSSPGWNPPREWVFLCSSTPHPRLRFNRWKIRLTCIIPWEVLSILRAFRFEHENMWIFFGVAFCETKSKYGGIFTYWNTLKPFAFGCKQIS